jgi:ubiquinone/menaquinone biosynthesis C-methylase UbiE
MPINTVAWNRLRYSFYAPFSDLSEKILGKARKQAITQIAPMPGERIILIGCGTGMDLEYFPKGTDVVAIDISRAMVTRAAQRGSLLGLNVDARVMNAECLDLESELFDVAVLHLILAVTPDPIACIKEAARVLKPNGRISIFDKFVPNGENITLARKFLNLFTNAFFTDITRHLEPLVKSAGLRIVKDKPAMLNGEFRTVTAIKSTEDDGTKQDLLARYV